MDITAGYIAAAALGATFGFQGAVSPGPLQTLLISETLSHGIKSSWRIAFVPPATDPLALTLALLCTAALSESLLACIAFAGALLLMWIAYGEFRTSEEQFKFENKPRRSFWQMWRVNFLNPNLWIFSFTINAIQIGDFSKNFGWGVALTYLLSFFIAIVLANLGIAILVGEMRKLFNPRWLVRINRLLGCFLVVVAFRFVWLGLVKLGMFQS